MRCRALQSVAKVPRAGWLAHSRLTVVQINFESFAKGVLVELMLYASHQVAALVLQIMFAWLFVANLVRLGAIASVATFVWLLKQCSMG